ncbi:hypothetical protein ElyMa_002379600 [Elysia marginata]|uniref:C2H2-type domain-containing protein n=1 Tax=Elysia marginata TaxID=1093978 RepID=A0AAV4GD37_9GAST|nr:hypothetical protein ElyMa_002379600 [Elysia marginata]
MAGTDNSYKVTGKVCPPTLPMNMMMNPDQWSSELVLPDVLQSLLVESPAQETRGYLPESLCAVVSQAQVVLSTDEGSSMSSVVSLPYYFCNFCNHHTDSRALLLKHLAQNHIFKCNLCNFSTFNRCSLIQHQLKCHIDAEEVCPVLSTKFVQVNLSHFQRTMHAINRNDLPCSSSDVSPNQVSSATSHPATNFLLPDPQEAHNERAHDPVSTTGNGSTSFGNNFLIPEKDATHRQFESLPHFLDIGHSCVSSSNVSPQVHISTALQPGGDTHCSEPLKITCNQKSGSRSEDTIQIKEAELYASHAQPSGSGLRNSSTSSGKSKEDSGLKNFLVKNSDNVDLEPQDHQSTSKSREGFFGSGQKKRKYDILRGLLVGEPSPKVGSLSEGNESGSVVKETKTVAAADDDLYKAAQLKKASDMTLKELLMQPKNSNPNEQVKLKSDFTSSNLVHQLSDPTIVLVCGFCNLECSNKPQLVSHMKECPHKAEPHTTSGRCKLMESDSNVIGWRTTTRKIVTHVNNEATPKLNPKTSFLPTSCIASEMLRTLSQNASVDENQNNQNTQLCVRSPYSQTETGNRSLGDSQGGTPDTLHSSGSKDFGSRVSGRLRFRNKRVNYNQASVTISDDDDDDDYGKTRYSKKKKFALEQHEKGNDGCLLVQYSHEDDDENVSLSDCSYHSSSDSVDEGRTKKKCRRVAERLPLKENENGGRFFSCLHCSFSNGNTHILRNHLRVCHPTCVPFAEACLGSHKKSLVYFCQGSNNICSFVSSKASEIFSHIRDCYLEILDGYSEHPRDFSPVLSSLGIASKLMDSSPSTFYCLRCDFVKHSLQPILEHVAANHGDSVAGILHVNIGTQEPKHTKVNMLCVLCKADISVKEWHSHQCRMLRKKPGNREREGNFVGDNFLESSNLSNVGLSEPNIVVSSENTRESTSSGNEALVKEEKLDFTEQEAETSLAQAMVKEEVEQNCLDNDNFPDTSTFEKQNAEDDSLSCFLTFV